MLPIFDYLVTEEVRKMHLKYTCAKKNWPGILGSLS